MIGRANGVGPKLAARIANELQGKLGVAGLGGGGASAARRSGGGRAVRPGQPRLQAGRSKRRRQCRAGRARAGSRRSTRSSGWRCAKRRSEHAHRCCRCATAAHPLSPAARSTPANIRRSTPASTVPAKHGITATKQVRSGTAGPCRPHPRRQVARIGWPSIAAAQSIREFRVALGDGGLRPEAASRATAACPKALTASAAHNPNSAVPSVAAHRISDCRAGRGRSEARRRIPAATS